MNRVKSPRVRAHGLLERELAFEVLRDALAESAGGKGRLVVVAGEAGIGKTALARQFCDDQPPEIRVLWGACDALFTPRPLGPLLDVAEATGGELESLVQSDARPHDVASALSRELRTRPTVLVLEDVHWADEATLDVLKLLGRRIETTSALVLGTYRDDELDRTHPLRIVLGELATQEAIVRLKISPLSPKAVAALAEPYGVDADELHRRTAGNPFFVTEVLAAGGGEIPQTVRDAVLARAARLSPAARALLEAVAVVPLQAQLWLLEAAAGADVGHLEECLTSGMLIPEPGGVAFRNELARLAVEESLAPNRAAVLHRRVLDALAGPPIGDPDLARLAHHAEAAGDTEAVLRYARPAAERAASLGAHREAGAQYARALRFADGLPLEAQAELLERRSYECYLTGQFDEALDAQEGALDCYRSVRDVRNEGGALRSLSRLLRYVGRTEEAGAAGREAVVLLERLPPGRELALALSNVSHLCMSIEDADGTSSWGARAIELAETLGEVEPLVYALTNIGTVKLLAGEPGARVELERALALAREAGLEEHAGRAFVSLTWWAPRDRSYAVADNQLEAGLEYCFEHGLDLWRLYLLAYRARSELDRGFWPDAVDSARLVILDPRSSPVPRITALSVLGLVRARRGDPDAWSVLDEAHELAAPTRELQRVWPPAAARAETAWLEGRFDAVAEMTEAALSLAVRCRASWVVGELACWRRRAGLEDDALPDAAGPYALQINGEWARAAALWTELGCPYDAALALSDADDDQALHRALEELDRLGAHPAAAIVARRLRERGARGIARGPRRATRESPAGLTARETEVLRLVADGLRNAEIAERLFLSPRTVDHHVSAIIRKLGTHSRGEAVAEGARLGLLQDG